MKIGFGLPNLGIMGTRDIIRTIAIEAEKLGYDSLWASERLLYPTNPKNLFNNAPWPPTYQHSLNTFETLAFAAAVTEKIRLGTSTLNFPFYHPAYLAKAFASLDVLSEGRVTIGAGQGWSEDEYDASGVPFSERTGRFVEIIEALNVLWGADPVEFHGQYFDVPSTLFSPKPVQKPRPPLVIAAFAPAAVARAARLVDGFNPIGGPNAAQVEQTVKAELQAWREAGREPQQPLIIMRVNHAIVSDQSLGDDRQFLTGFVEQVRADVQQLEAWGVTEVFFSSRVGYGQPNAREMQLDQLTKLRGVV